LIKIVIHILFFIHKYNIYFSYYLRTYPSSCQLAHYPAFIAQSATLTQMTQGPHKYHTDPDDHTHSRPRTTEHLENTTHAGNCTERLYTHIYCARVTQVDITQIITHTSQVLHYVARDIALTKEITQSATLHRCRDAT
jgi:hypothetical protein